jgi:integrase/recombinase XerD
VTHCRQIMLEELQCRNFAPTTISTYLDAVEQFARHFKCRPDRLNQTHLRSYQAYLLRERKMRPLTVRLHVAALRFFFVKTLRCRCLLDDTPYPKAPRRLPQILRVGEMAASRRASRSHCATSQGTTTAIISSRSSCPITLLGMRRDCEGDRR